jgi:hypothetical protein
MPKDQLFIPEKIRVGYQNRNDTYTKKLAYVIYYDEKGKIRKETSFNSWRDDKIPVDEFENKPHTGFVLNKDVKRSSEWFGNGRNMIRIYDDRGIEFEITTSNLLFILMTTNCHKRGLEGDFVYAWYSGELVLLPTGCDEYINSAKFTSLQSQKFSARDLKPGGAYKTKKQEDLIYLGRFPWYTFEYENKRNWSGDRLVRENKMHIFVNKKNEFIPQSGATYLAEEITDIPVDNYADLMDLFNKDEHSSKPVSFEEKPMKLEFEEKEAKDYWSYKDTKTGYKKIDDNKYRLITVCRERDYDRTKGTPGGYYFTGFTIGIGSVIQIDADGSLRELSKDSTGDDHSYSYNDRIGYYHGYKKTLYQLQEVEAMNFIDLKIVLENGSRVPATKYSRYYY